METFPMSEIDQVPLESKITRDVFQAPKQGNSLDLCKLCLNSAKLHTTGHLRFTKRHDNFKFLEDELQFSLPLEVCKTCLEKLHEILLFIKKCKESYELYTKTHENTISKREEVYIKEEPLEIEEIDYKVQTDDLSQAGQSNSCNGNLENEKNLQPEEDEIEEKNLNLITKGKKMEERCIKIEPEEESEQTLPFLNMEVDSDYPINYSPPDSPELLAEASDNETVSLLKEKSNQIYERQYKKFIKWCEGKKIKDYTENVFLAFFSEQTKAVRASTLWSIYSMLKSTFLIKHNIDISKFKKVNAFIKKQNIGYKPQKSSIFTREEVERFLIEAPNDVHLMHKVCLIFGIAGSCRIDELKKLSIDDVEIKKDVLMVTIPDSKRVFIVTNQMYENINPIDLYTQYISLRPSHTAHKSLFIYYRSGRCSTQKVGVHTFGKIPKIIATYLQLSNVDSYTGHAFKRTSASLLPNTGITYLH